MNIYQIIAQTVILQQQIFNCSVEQIWEKHIHPGIREVHSLNKVMPYIEQAKIQSSSGTFTPSDLDIQGFFVEHQGYVITLIDTTKGTVLQVYQNGDCVYKHPYYNPLSNNIPMILRRYLNIRRLPALKSWKRIDYNKFDCIINQKLKEV